MVNPTLWYLDDLMNGLFDDQLRDQVLDTLWYSFFSLLNSSLWFFREVFVKRWNLLGCLGEEYTESQSKRKMSPISFTDIGFKCYFPHITELGVQLILMSMEINFSVTA